MSRQNSAPLDLSTSLEKVRALNSGDSFRIKPNRAFIRPGVYIITGINGERFSLLHKDVRVQMELNLKEMVSLTSLHILTTRG